MTQRHVCETGCCGVPWASVSAETGLTSGLKMGRDGCVPFKAGAVPPQFPVECEVRVCRGQLPTAVLAVP